jgi:protein TonB
MKKFLPIFLVAAPLFISVPALSQDTIAIVSADSLSPEFALVEKESEFPGGLEGWRKFLIGNLKYPAKARKKKIQGTVVVQFIVNKDGSLSDYKAISGPDELRKAAVEVIRRSPKWIPAEQSGKKVRSFKVQPIGFRL